MRDDPQDQQDARFIIQRRQWDRSEIEAILNNARIPEIDEIKEQFDLAKKRLLSTLPE